MLKTLLIASHNAGKVREIGALLAPLNINVKSAAEFNLPEPEETGDSFNANAELKARAAAEATGLPSLSDDSGLVIPALGGDPGIYSARWAGPSKDFNVAFARIEKELTAKNIPPTGTAAYFICVLCLCIPRNVSAAARTSLEPRSMEFSVENSGSIHLFEGKINGTLSFPPHGAGGFGYDPIFIPQDHQITFAEMKSVEKQAISHRARAFEKLVNHLKDK